MNIKKKLTIAKFPIEYLMFSDEEDLVYQKI